HAAAPARTQGRLRRTPLNHARPPAPLKRRTYMYQPAIDLDTITAIDVHTHVEADDHRHTSLDSELLDASAAYFRAPVPRTPTVADLADYYRQHNMAAVVFTVDATTALGHPPVSSEMIAEQAAQHNDVLIPFGSVDPRTPAEAVARIKVLAEDYG